MLLFDMMAFGPSPQLRTVRPSPTAVCKNTTVCIALYQLPVYYIACHPTSLHTAAVAGQCEARVCRDTLDALVDALNDACDYALDDAVDDNPEDNPDDGIDRDDRDRRPSPICHRRECLFADPTPLRSSCCCCCFCLRGGS